MLIVYYGRKRTEIVKVKSRMYENVKSKVTTDGLCQVSLNITIYVKRSKTMIKIQYAVHNYCSLQN